MQVLLRRRIVTETPIFLLSLIVPVGVIGACNGGGPVAPSSGATLSGPGEEGSTETGLGGDNGETSNLETDGTSSGGDIECPPGFADCNSDPNDGCEQQLSSDPLNCGRCEVSCHVSTSCVEGACIPADRLVLLYAGDLASGMGNSRFVIHHGGTGATHAVDRAGQLRETLDYSSINLDDSTRVEQMFLAGDGVYLRTEEHIFEQVFDYALWYWPFSGTAKLVDGDEKLDSQLIELIQVEEWVYAVKNGIDLELVRFPVGEADPDNVVAKLDLDGGGRIRLLGVHGKYMYLARADRSLARIVLETGALDQLEAIDGNARSIAYDFSGAEPWLYWISEDTAKIAGRVLQPGASAATVVERTREVTGIIAGEGGLWFQELGSHPYLPISTGKLWRVATSGGAIRHSEPELIAEHVYAPFQRLHIDPILQIFAGNLYYYGDRRVHAPGIYRVALEPSHEEH